MKNNKDLLIKGLIRRLGRKYRNAKGHERKRQSIRDAFQVMGYLCSSVVAFK